MRARNWSRLFSALACAGMLFSGSLTPVIAEGGGSTPVETSNPAEIKEDEKTQITFVLKNSDGSETSVAFDAKKGEAYGPEADAQVRSTYYDQETGKDYDLDAGQALSGTVTDGLVFHYTEHQDAALTATAYFVDADSLSKTVLKKEEFTVAPGRSVDVEAPETLETKDGRVYQRDEGMASRYSFNYENTTSLQQTILYHLVEDEKTTYTVTVRYVDEDGNLITTREMHINNKEYFFYAPHSFSTETDGRKSYYFIKNDKDSFIDHKVDDPAREYTITYRKQKEDEAYDWIILLYDSQTNKCIDQKSIEVKPGETEKFTPEAEFTAEDGTTYYLNTAMKSEYDHTFGDDQRITYVYYDTVKDYKPEGNKIVTVNYVNIADKSVIKTVKEEAAPGHDTVISYPAEMEQDGITYKLIQGQLSEITHNYYSPKEVYNVYYYDVNNTDFETYTIVREVNLGTVFTDGGVEYRTIPGTTTVVANTPNGPTTIAVENNRGETVNANDVTTPAGNQDLDKDKDKDKEKVDVAIDGVQAEDIDTPAGNKNLAEERSAALLKGGLLAGAALLALFVIILIIRKHKEKKEQEEK